MSNERIRAERDENHWPDLDDRNWCVNLTGDGLKFPHSVWLATEADGDGLIALVNGAPAAPSEGDGRRALALRWWVERDDEYEGIDGEPHTLYADLTPAGRGERWVISTLTTEQADRLEVAAAPLPPGVHRAPDGTLWLLPGAKMPAGYEFRSRHTSEWESPFAGALAAAVWSKSSAYEIRPVPPVPEPERIKWFDAVEQKRSAPDGRVIATGGVWNTGTFWVGDGEGKFIAQADADGLVSVLPLGDPKAAS